MSVILVFVDGIGVGERSVARNPLARGDFLLSQFLADGRGALPREGRLAPLDACLGVEGLPQSATGQATLFTGVNASALLGRHLWGFPGRTLRELLAARSLFLQLRSAGARATFANAFPRPYLSLLGLPYQGPQAAPLEVPARVARRLRPSCSTCAASAAGPLRTLEDAFEGRAVTHDVTGRSRPRGFDAPVRSPADAARILLALAAEHELVLFEHFLLDEAGHAQSMDDALAILRDLDALLRALALGLGPSDHLLVVSDHGNVEDLSTRSHTKNPVPLLCFGPRAEEAAQRARSLVDLTPLALALALEREEAPLLSRLG